MTEWHTGAIGVVSVGMLGEVGKISKSVVE